MLCLDTTVFIDLWRSRGQPPTPVWHALEPCRSETHITSATTAGEFLEGAAFISEQRLQESLTFLARTRVEPVTLATALQYARLVADLRHNNQLQGRSKADLWNAATALEHGASLVTRNPQHFANVPNLRVIAY